MVSKNDGSSISPGEFQRYLRELTRQVEESIYRSVGIPAQYMEDDVIDAARYAWSNMDPNYRGYYNPNIIEGKARVIEKPVLLLGPGGVVEKAEQEDED